MNEVKKDQELGMGREITRRDFLNGVAVGVGGSLAGGTFGAQTLLAAALDEFAPEKAAEAVRKNRHRQFRCRRDGRDGRRHRPGLPCRGRASPRLASSDEFCARNEHAGFTGQV